MPSENAANELTIGDAELVRPRCACLTRREPRVVNGNSALHQADGDEEEGNDNSQDRHRYGSIIQAFGR